MNRGMTIKTYDEALEDYVTCVRESDLQVAQEHQYDVGMRNLEVVIEVINNPKTAQLVMLYLDLASQGMHPVLMACHIFAHGVTIGIDMERQEIE